MIRSRSWALCGLVFLMALGVLQAAVPVLDHVFPAAIQIGTTQLVTLVGKFDPWPTRLDLDIPGVSWEPTTNSGVIRVRVAPEAPAGPRVIRAFSPEGVSEPRFLILSQRLQQAEVEPNDAVPSAQVLAGLPAEVNGRLEKNGDVDSYSVDLRAGQTLMARLEAYTLQSPLDPVLKLLDARGVQVAWNHDEVRSLDPILAWRVETSGTYVLQVFGFAYPADSDLRFSGSPKGVYRLHVTTDPVARHAWPLGVSRAVDTRVSWGDWGVSSVSSEAIEVLASAIAPGAISHSLRIPHREVPLELSVGEGKEWVESEPNDAATTAQALGIPSAVSGDLDRPGDEDRYRLSCQKGEPLRLEVQAAGLGFPLDAWLRIEDASGKELARNDDTGGSDPVLDWTSPETAEYRVVVGNLLQRGGRDQRYRLSIQRPKPLWSASMAEAAWSLEPGKTNESKVTLTRRYGADQRLTVSVRGLPSGVRVDSVEVSEKANAATLRWIAATNAAPFSGPVSIDVSSSSPAAVQEARFSLVSAGENNGVPQGFRRLVVESISRLWLTVLRAPSVPADKK
ncbi:MAG: hypothetical protein NTX70_07580 [Verrucomicrobia bacterium]|nr:hypothetical protein [Verrucomicrobiota bacterium]